MKKLTFMATVAIMAITMASCNQTRPPKAELKSDIDTLSYVIGAGIGNEFVSAGMLERLSIDSAYMADFVRGINDAFSTQDDKKKAAYYAGLQIGQQLGQQIIPNMQEQYFGDDSTKTFTKDNVLAAFDNAILKQDGPIAKEEVTARYQKFMTDVQTLARERQEAEYMKQLDERNREKFADNRKAGEEFLAANKQKEGVKTTESGLQYKVITEGTGEVPTVDQNVKVEYEGRLIDGTVFDASSQHGDEPAVFSPGRVIKGWKEALTMMPVGSEWELYIPQELAYGPEENGNIKPYSALVFKVKLLDIVK